MLPVALTRARRPCCWREWESGALSQVSASGAHARRPPPTSKAPVLSTVEVKITGANALLLGPSTNESYTIEVTAGTGSGVATATVTCAHLFQRRNASFFSFCSFLNWENCGGQRMPPCPAHRPMFPRQGMTLPHAQAQAQAQTHTLPQA